MLSKALLTWTLALPAVLALSIETYSSTSTATVCSTRYGKKSLSSVPTSSSQETIELSPVVLHNSTTYTQTVTPKPRHTHFSQLETSTVWVTRTPVDGTFNITSTMFSASTYWHHATVTVTETKFKYKTSRTTTWIPTSTGFLPIRNTTESAYPGTENKREINHPHPGLSARKNTKKAKCRRPTASSFPTAVDCTEYFNIHTTEIMIFPHSRHARVTLQPETFFKTRTIWGTLTSTILSIPTSAFQSETSSFESPLATSNPGTGSVSEVSETRGTSATDSTSLSKRSFSSKSDTASLTSPSVSTPTTTSHSTSISTTLLTTGSHMIIQKVHHVTKTPYTITFTWTLTSTHTTTSTRHATTTLTSHAACSTSNQLFNTHKNQRVNGLSILAGTVSLSKTPVLDESSCCELCMRDPLCAYSLFEAEGRDKGACYVYGVENQGVCTQAANQAAYSFKPWNGEVRYVAGNGNCGFFSDYDYVFS